MCGSEKCKVKLVMDKLEDREQDLIQHVRTAGLQKRREISLVDEILELRKERRQQFSALQSQVKVLSSEKEELLKQGNCVIDDAKRQLHSIKSHYEEKIHLGEIELRRRSEEFEAEKLSLVDRLKVLTENQESLTSKYCNNVSRLDSKVKELTKLQQMNEMSLRKDIETSVFSQVSNEFAARHEVEISK